MKKINLLIISAIIIFQCSAQQSNGDSTVYLIHKFQQAIGKETSLLTTGNNKLTYNVVYYYNDRGQPVHLTSTITVNSNAEPSYFRIEGGTSRFSGIHDSVVISKGNALIKVNDSSYKIKPQPNSFTVAGYSPATAQMLLIKYWKTHQQPALIHALPTGDIMVKRDGLDTFDYNNNKLVLTRYIIKGLIWGNELLWTDAKDNLICLITNDAEGDKQEVMLEAYENILPSVIEKAAIDGMRLFTSTAKPAYTKHKIIAITNARLIDVVNGNINPSATIIIQGNKITQVGGSANIKVPADAFVIDANGKTALPGLWDMHSHFEQAEWGPAYLAAGVTTVRDCGNEFVYINTIKKTIDEGNGVGPHIIKAGIIDGKGPYALGIIQADTKEEAVAAVDRYKENGFEQIKIYSSVKPKIVKAICDEAHKQGLTVTGHIPQGMNIIQGVDSGMDMVNHLQYVSSALKKDREHFTVDFNDSTNAALIQFLKAHHTVIDPTMGVFEMIFRSVKDSITNMEPNFYTLPKPLQEIFKNTGMSADSDIIYGQQVMKIFKKVLYELYKDSIPIVAGTDMGFPGYSVCRELELYVDCGLTPLQAIQTATITPASVMNDDDVTGSIDVDKTADLILIDGDPLSNIRDIRKVTTVIKDGNVYNPVQLHKIAGFQ